jgi:Mannosylglycerate hydrolase MGH1-like glycoside hydrolase domain
MRKFFLFIIVGLTVLSCVQPTFAQSPNSNFPEYQNIKSRLIQGWNTWDSRSVLSHVLLPEGFCINLAFKQHYWLEEGYLSEALIGRYGDYVEKVRPGLHAYDGRYTELDMKWEEVDVHIESAHAGEDIVILITPNELPKNRVKLIIESGMLWNRSGLLKKENDVLIAELNNRTIQVFSTGGETEYDPYVETKTPFLAHYLDGPIGISTGRSRSVDEIRAILDEQKDKFLAEADKYGELAEASLAVQAGVAWNLIYEPKFDRVVATVGRLWNAEYGGYCLFGWDNFFLAYVTSLESRDLAFANVLEHLDGMTPGGFIPNDNRGNETKSFDRSQPPVGSIMVKEIYKQYPEKWFLEATFNRLLTWNRWWPEARINEGLLSFGSHITDNPYFEPSTNTKRTAGYESGMDDSPMYVGVPFNKEKNTLELQDVGLTSLYIADCRALAEMASVLGKKSEKKELTKRADKFARELEKLWDDEVGLYLNRRTDTGELSHRISPTAFYPLLAGVPSKKKANRIVQEHFFNPEEFYGDWMLPSITRNDELFEKQRYWKGAIWPPLNFLSYLGLRNYGMEEAHKVLSEKSLQLIINEWQRMGFVGENYSSITGTADDSRLSSDRFHSWGTLFGITAFIEAGFLPPFEDKIK